MDLTNIFTNFSGQGFINIFFKAFALLFSLLYLIYAIIIAKQTQVMNDTLKTGGAAAFGFISLVQIFVGIALLLLAIFLV